MTPIGFSAKHRFPRVFLVLAALCAANALVLVFASLETRVVLARVQLFAVLGHALLGTFLVAWVLKDTRFERVPLTAVVALAILVRFISVWASPLLEDDHYRYLWDGFRTAVAFNPYGLAPNEFFANDTLDDRWQNILSGINHPELPTIYGPVLQYFFALAYFIQPGKLGAIQGLLLSIDLVVIALLIFERLPIRWLLVYAIHPAITKEIMASAHPDILVGLFLLAACLAWKRQRRFLTGTLLGLAIATKAPAVLGCVLLLWKSSALPTSPVYPLNVVTAVETRSRIFWRALIPDWHWALPNFLAMALVLIFAYLPFWWASGSDIASLLIFGERWKFNPLLFRVIELALGPELARPAALFLFTVVCFGLTWSWRKKSPAYPPIELLFTALLLLAPVVNPWYWTWGLALAVLKRSQWVIFLSCAGCLSYLNHTVLSEAGMIASRDLAASFGVPWLVTIAQLALALVLLIIFRKSSPRKNLIGA